MNKFLTVILLSLTACGCNRVSSLIHDDAVVARVGEDELLRSELDFVIPKYLSQEDSASLAASFIRKWAVERLFTRVAEDELTDKEKDVTAELEDYRRSLLRFRYEQRYVAERLDTLVSDAQVNDYYGSHQEMFVLERPIVKFRYIDILRNTAGVSAIVRAMSSDEYSELDKARSLADSTAIRYIDRSEEWTDIAILAKEFGLDWAEMLQLQKNSEIKLDLKDRMDIKLAYLCDIRRTGVAPVEFCHERIREIILNARKHSLLKGLEQDLLDDALDRRQFVILGNE